MVWVSPESGRRGQFAHQNRSIREPGIFEPTTTSSEDPIRRAVDCVPGSDFQERRINIFLQTRIPVTCTDGPFT